LPAEIVDARGEKCPLPVLRMEKRLMAIAPGAEIIVRASDPMAKVDIPLYCRQNGHACAVTTTAAGLEFHIIKARAPA
jgi:tRNA 2-thiouridine synthesizing protein A